MKILDISSFEKLKINSMSVNDFDNIIFNKYAITQNDMIGDLEGFPIGIVIKMMEEQEKQGNKPDVKIFQISIHSDKNLGGFDWDTTEDRYDFWYLIIDIKNFKHFYEKYPEYKKYDK